MIAKLGRAIAVLICLVGMPIHLCIWALIRMHDSGPALYRSRRLGKGGVGFEMLKYRTMKADARPVVKEGFKTIVVEADPRVTGPGRWLRCGIDELPQLWNIVRGEMAWIGPRPDEEWMLHNYGVQCTQRLVPLPGITGYAQVLYSRNVSTAEGYAIDLWYRAHGSIWLDAWIVIATPMFMAGWRAVGADRLRKLRLLPEFKQLRQRCDAELAAAEKFSLEALSVG